MLRTLKGLRFYPINKQTNQPSTFKDVCKKCKIPGAETKDGLLLTTLAKTAELMMDT